MTLLHYVKYRDKLKGCYIGKAIGCALGKPHEGKVGIRPVDGYDPVPVGMPANDGFDFQAVWLEVLRRKGLPVNRYDLSQGWKEHIRMAWDEYGAAERNLAGQLYPPLSGSFDNKFSDGMGGAARAEL